MATKINSQIDEFSSAVNRLTKILNSKYSNLANEIDLTEVQYITGMHIKQLGHPKMSELAENMNVNVSSLTGIIDRMVKNGYIERERDETDRRLVKVNLTGEGLKAVDKLNNDKHNQLKTIILALNEEDRETFVNLLRKLVERLEKKS